MRKISVKSFLIWTSGSVYILLRFLSTALVTIVFGGENELGNFGRGRSETHFCKNGQFLYRE